MNLSNELFEQIAASLTAGQDENPNGDREGSDQRARRRFATTAGQRATLIPLTDSIATAPIGVTLRDISPGGVGFFHTGRVVLSDEFVLMMPTAQGSAAVLCGVAYWQPVAEGTVAVGAKFIRVLREGLSKPLPAPAPQPIRKAV